MLMDELTVVQAAERLAVVPSRVRALVASGRLSARRVGGVWLVDPEAVDRRADAVPDGAKGRPMASRTAWGAAAMLDGEQAGWLTGGEQTRLAKRLAARSGGRWQAFYRWLESRQTSVVRYRAARDDIAALFGVEGVAVTGAAGARAHGLDLGASSGGELYATPDVSARLVDEFFLVRSSSGNVTVRTSPDGWHLLASHRRANLLVVPRLVVAVDLLGADDSRSRSAGRDLFVQTVPRRGT